MAAWVVKAAFLRSIHRMEHYYFNNDISLYEWTHWENHLFCWTKKIYYFMQIWGVCYALISCLLFMCNFRLHTEPNHKYFFWYRIRQWKLQCGPENICTFTFKWTKLLWASGILSKTYTIVHSNVMISNLSIHVKLQLANTREAFSKALKWSKKKDNWIIMCT